MAPDATGAPASERAATWLFAVAVAAAAATIRWLAARDALWLDEIWALSLALQASSAWDVLVGLHQEGNHYLVTLWAWLLGPQPDWMVYRLPSIVAGTGSVILAGVIAGRRSAAAAVFALLLTGGSYLGVHYSSEARGYALAVFWALACLECQERLFAGGGRWTVFGTAASAILGFLSQPVFVAFYGAAIAWSAIRVLRAPAPRDAWLRAFVFSHGPPLAFIGWLYLVDLRRAANVGGPVYPLFDVIAETASLAVGTPIGVVGALFAAALFVGSLVVLWRVDRDWCLLGVLGVVVSPALLLLVTQRHEVYPRYFLLPVVLFELTLALACGALWRRGRAAVRVACACVVAALLAGNAWHVARLLELGRGAYVEAMAYLAANTRGEEITLGGDTDYPNQLVLSFYGPLLPAGRRLTYYPWGAWPPGEPEWFLLHRAERDTEWRPEWNLAPIGRYRIAKHWRFAGLSGWDMALYHREDAPAP